MNDLNSTLKLRLFQLFTGGLAGNLIKPFFAAILAVGLGASQAGFWLVISGIFALFAGLIGGPHADKKGRKNTLMHSEYLRLAGALCLALGFMRSDPNYALLVVGFSIHSLGAAYGRPAGDALIYDNITDQNRKFVLRLHYWVWNITVLTGYLLGGMFIAEHQDVLFFGLFAVSIVDILVIRQLNDPGNYRPLTLRDYHPKKIPLNLLREDKNMRKYTIASSMQLIIEIGAISLLSVTLVEANRDWLLFSFTLDPLYLFGLLITLNAAILLLGGILQMRYLKNISPQIEINLGGVLQVIGFGGLFLSTNIIQMLFCVTCLSIGELFFKSGRNDLFSRLLPSDKKGAYSAVNSVMFRLASSIAPLMLVFHDVTSPIMIAMTIVITLVLSWVLLRQLAITYSEEKAL
ncbi:MFS transporter [Vibrio sp. SCSIO 43132]|uniref:MFS transporter n=1 Tax=Vibrio sp. SCSIO 43132 TaxID=2779363 RepID=UPI001CA94A5A|nr:MFS transporter [Vibrio sp. SCSIO 43132]UAB73914.1 MFS transporter [Vibrio sp. SCSIO 43132]